VTAGDGSDLEGKMGEGKKKGRRKKKRRSAMCDEKRRAQALIDKKWQLFKWCFMTR